MTSVGTVIPGNSLRKSVEVMRRLVSTARRRQHQLLDPVLQARRGLSDKERLLAVLQPLRKIRLQNFGAEKLQLFDGNAVWIVWCLHHEGQRRRRDERDSCDPARAVPRQIAHDLATAEGMADQRHATQIELRQERG